jgi:hypothetical protein
MTKGITCSRAPIRAVNGSRFACIVFAATVGSALSAGNAEALIIHPTFDSSVTKQANASTIENAFNKVASEFSAAFSNPVTVNITVSWGSVGYQPLGSGDIAGSVENLSGPYSYSSFVSYMKEDLPYNPGDAVFAQAVKSLPSSDPTKLNKYEIPYAEAKALGLLSANGRATDGYVGFKAGLNYDYSPTNGVAAGAYDFQGLAAHEIAEVLGRITGLPTSGAASFATPMDAFRYTSAGVGSFSSSAAAYFSIDGGKTDLGNFNTVGGGDRGDWLAATAGGDASSAFFSTGKAYSLSANDLTALDALGWGIWSPAAVNLASTATTTFSPIGHSVAAVPEPGVWAFMLTGFGVVGGSSRRTRSRRVSVRTA